MRDQETPRKHTPDTGNPNAKAPRALTWTPQGIMEIRSGDNLRHAEDLKPQLPTEEFLRQIASPSHLTIMVYGTLKKGLWNHDRFCQAAIDIRPATVRGHLHHLSAGYPALEVPESAILAHGTTDPLADAATQARLAAHAPQHAANQHPPGDWDLVHDELVTFPDPARDLPPIDRLEGFRLGQDSLYQRVLATARTLDDETIPAWLYVAGSRLIGSGERLRNGVWE